MKTILDQNGDPCNFRKPKASTAPNSILLENAPSIFFKKTPKHYIDIHRRVTVSCSPSRNQNTKTLTAGITLGTPKPKKTIVVVVGWCHVFRIGGALRERTRSLGQRQSQKGHADKRTHPGVYTR